MRRLCDVQEELGVSAPVLVLLGIDIQAAALILCVPLAWEALLDVGWELCQVAELGREDSQEERPLLILLLTQRVRDDDVVHLLFLVLREQPSGLGYLALGKALHALCGLKNDVVSVYFPQTVALALCPHHDEVHWNIGLLTGFFIFLHERNDYLCFLCNSQTELWIIEPFII